MAARARRVARTSRFARSSRYPALLPVVSLEMNGNAVVRVERFAELVRLADQFDQLILERHVGDQVRYAVGHDSTAYVYSSARTAPLLDDADLDESAPIPSTRHGWRRQLRERVAAVVDGRAGDDDADA